MTILSKAQFFPPRSWNSNNLLVTKIIEEVKTLVDEIKNLYKYNFNRTNSRKANKTIENFEEKSFSLHYPLSREGCSGIGLPSPSSFCAGEAPSNSTQDPQRNIDSSTLVLGRPTIFFPFALASKACLKVFPDVFCLHCQTIWAEIFQFGEVAALENFESQEMHTLSIM